ncbi:MAG: pectin acetylesterase-family hydrolase [Polyangiaceae bacterium]
MPTRRPASSLPLSVFSSEFAPGSTSRPAAFRGLALAVGVALAACGTLVGCSSADEMPNADAGTNGDAATSDGGLDANTGDGGTAQDSGTSNDASTEPEDVGNGWTWTPVAGALCDEGTPTGVGVYKTDSPNLLVFMMGGGACWDYDSCVASSLSNHGPYGAEQFKGELVSVATSVLGTSSASPFATWNKIFVPYCTGDLHTGNKTATYTNASGGDAHVLHHVGRTNVEGMVAKVLPQFSPTTVVVSGSSAGGFGALFNYTLVRGAYPSAKAYLIDDSAPTLVLGDSQKTVRPKALASWGSGAVLTQICSTCLDEWADVLPTLTTKYPSDKFALLSNTQDGIMRFFFGLTGPQFLNSLNDLLAKYDTNPRTKYWVVEGTSHTFFRAPPPALWTWLGQMVTDDAGWASTKP